MTHKMTVGFETFCWEKDWEFLMKTKRLEFMIERNLFNFDKRTLFINNVSNEKRVRKQADKLIASGLLTDYYFVEDYAAEALEFLGLSKEALGKGYYYSIASLVGIYLNLCDYTLHFSGDSVVTEPVDWVQCCIDEMQKNDRIKFSSLMWDIGSPEHSWMEARKDSVEENDKFLVSRSCFSDQCYLIKTEDFRGQIYNEDHPSSAAYPVYGGELFEKRVNSWLRNRDYHRLIFKGGQYIHRNFPNHPLKRKWYLISGKYNI
jgi:hypothetical protein